MLKKWLGFFLLGVTSVAAATDLAGATSNLWGPVSLFTSVMELACYVIGAAFCIGSVMQYRIHRQNPKLTPLMTPAVMLVVGICLLLLPYFSAMPSDSFNAKQQSQRKDASVRSLVREYQAERDQVPPPAQTQPSAPAAGQPAAPVQPQPDYW